MTHQQPNYDEWLWNWHFWGKKYTSPVGDRTEKLGRWSVTQLYLLLQRRHKTNKGRSWSGNYNNSQIRRKYRKENLSNNVNKNENQHHVLFRQTKDSQEHWSVIEYVITPLPIYQFINNLSWTYNTIQYVKKIKDGLNGQNGQTENRLLCCRGTTYSRKKIQIQRHPKIRSSYFWHR